MANNFSITLTARDELSPTLQKAAAQAKGLAAELDNVQKLAAGAGNIGRGFSTATGEMGRTATAARNLSTETLKAGTSIGNLAAGGANLRNISGALASTATAASGAAKSTAGVTQAVAGLNGTTNMAKGNLAALSTNLINTGAGASKAAAGFSGMTTNVKTLGGTFGTATAGTKNFLAAQSGFASQMAVMTKATAAHTAATDAANAAQARFKTTLLGMKGAAVGLLAAAAPIGMIVKEYANFDEAMSTVSANTGASTQELNKLREAATKLGADSKFSSTEAAEGINEMAKAGVETQAILGGGLKGALDLAAAGALNVSDASEIAATAMTQFKLKGSDIPHVADLLAAGAGKAQGGVKELSDALKQGGLVSSQWGNSVDDTVGVLTAFASAGLMGSDAGTAFKSMLIRLMAPTTQVQKQLDELGIKTTDANGHFVSMENLAGQLQTKMGGLSESQRNAALATIFGNDAIRAGAILYAEGADGIRNWNQAVAEQGYAAKQAEALTDNLKGSVEKFMGALSAVATDSGGGISSMLRSVVDFGTAAIDTFNRIPGSVTSTVVAFAGVATAAVALKKVGAVVGAGMDVAKAKTATFGTAVSLAWAQAGQGAQAGALTTSRAAGVMATASRTAATGLTLLKGAAGGVLAALGGVWGVGLMAATAAVGMFMKKTAEAKQVSQSFADALIADGGRIGQSSYQAVFNNLYADQFAEQLKGVGIQSSLATQYILGNADAVKQVDAAYQAAVKAQDASYQMTQAGGRVVDENAAKQVALLGVLREKKDAFGQEYAATQERIAQEGILQSATGVTISQTEAVTGAMAGQADAMAAQGAETERLVFKLQDLDAGLRGTNTAAIVAAAGGMKEFEGEVTSTNINVKLLDASIQALLGGLSEEAAYDAAMTAINNVGNAAKGAKPPLEGMTEEAMKNRDAYREATFKSADYLQQMLKSGRPIEEVQAKAKTLTDNMNKQAKKYGFAKDEVNKYIKDVLAIPEEAKTNVQLTGVKDAKLSLKELEQMFLHLPTQKTVKVNYVQSGFDGTGGGMRVPRANGGIVTPRADGGIDMYGRRVPRISQIARNRNILWAEPEIGGAEAYISSKRGMEARNIRVLREAASWFGLTVQKAGQNIRQFATGGVAGLNNLTTKIAPLGMSGGLNLNLKNLTVQVKVEPPKKPIVIPVQFDWNKTQLATLTKDLKELLTGIKQPVESEAVEKIREGWDKIRETLADSVKDQNELNTALKEKNAAYNETLKGYQAYTASQAGKADAAAAKLVEKTKKSLDAASKALSREQQQYMAAIAAYTKAKANLEKVLKNTKSTNLEKTAAKAKVDAAKKKADNEFKDQVNASVKKDRANRAYNDAVKASRTTAAPAALKGALAQAPASQRNLFIAAGAKYGVSPNLLAAIAKQESNFKPNAKSKAGAQGLMQLMPGTARGLGVKNAYDPKQAVDGAAKLLAQYQKKYNNDVVKMLAAYNAGPGNVKRWNQIGETRNYVAKITADVGLKSQVKNGKVTAGASAVAQAKNLGKAVVKQANKAGATLKKTIATGAKGNSNIDAFVQNAMNQKGDRYIYGSHPRSSEKNPTSFDCSGLVNWAYGRVMGKYTEGDAAALYKRSTTMSVKEAANTKGALLFKYNGKKISHVAISLGDGKRTIEAMGSAYGVKVGNIGSRFNRAGMLPGLKGSGGNTTVNVSGGGSSSSGSTPSKVTKDQVDKAKKAADDAKKEAEANKKRAAAEAAVLKVMAAQQKQMEKVAKAHEATVAKLEEAKEALKDITDAYDNMAKSVASHMADQGSLSNIFKPEQQDDEAGGWTRTEMPDIIAARKKVVKDAQSFADAIKQLKAMGLNQTDLEDVIADGWQNNGGLARVILQSGAGGVAAINDTRRQIDEATNTLGTTAADSMYKAGKDAAEALVKGLESKEAALRSQLDKIAAIVQQAINLQYQLGVVQSNATAAKNTAAAAVANAQSTITHTTTVKQAAPTTLVVQDKNGSFMGTLNTVATNAATKVVNTTTATTAKEAKWSSK